jgi:hypothetical protein
MSGRNIHRQKRKYGARSPKYQVPGDEHLLLAVDLGKWKVGVAAFYVPGPGKSGELVTADTLVTPTSRVHEPERVAASIIRWYRDSMILDLDAVWVCEWPQKYARDREKHKDIEALWAVGECLSWQERYQPRQWKGSVPKRAFRARTKKALQESELKIMPSESQHDAWDAVGIGLYALARVARGGIR